MQGLDDFDARFCRLREKHPVGKPTPLFKKRGIFGFLQKNAFFGFLRTWNLQFINGLPIVANIVCKNSTLFLFNCYAVVGAGVVFVCY